jgi:L-fuconolactonase
VILDAHVHFWDPAARHHDWLTGALDRPFGPDDLPATHDVIFVEADCRVAEAADEAAWVAGLGDRRVRGIVANAPLEDGPDALETVRHLPLVCGIRRQLEPRPAAFALTGGFVGGVRRLGELGLPFDACVHRGQLPVLAALADAAPHTTIVLDHLGKPDGLDPWRADLAALAARPNVVAKLSGLATQLDPWEDQVVPYLEHALAVFGPDRCLVGSDWPVLTLAATYERWFAVVAAVAPERVLGATGREVYGC